MTLDKIIYLSSLVGRIQYILYGVLGFLVIIVFFNFLAGMIEHDYGDKAPYYFGEMKKYIKRTLVIALLVAFIPSRNEMLCISLTKGYKKEAIYRMTKKELRDNIDYLVNSLKAVKENNND